MYVLKALSLCMYACMYSIYERMYVQYMDMYVCMYMCVTNNTPIPCAVVVCTRRSTPTTWGPTPSGEKVRIAQRAGRKAQKVFAPSAERTDTY